MLFSKTMLLLTYLSEKVLQISFPFRCSCIAVNLPGLITACYSSWHNDWSKTNSKKYCSSAQLSFIELFFSLRATCANILFPLLGVIICLFIRPSLSLFTSRSDHTFVQKAKPVHLCCQITERYTWSPDSSFFCCWSPFLCNVPLCNSFFSNSSCSRFCSPPHEFEVYRPCLPSNAFILVQSYPHANRQVIEVVEDQC